jgi:hypothetical protein
VAAVQNILKSLSLFDPQRVSVGAQREKRNDGENSSAISKRRRRRRRQRPRKANAYWMDRIIRDPCFFFFFFLTACAVKILFEADEVYSTQFGQMFHFLVGSSGSFEMKKKIIQFIFNTPMRGPPCLIRKYATSFPIYIVIGHDPVPGALLVVVYSGR